VETLSQNKKLAKKNEKLQEKVSELTHKKKMYKSELVSSYKLLKDHKQQIKVMVSE